MKKTITNREFNRIGNMILANWNTFDNDLVFDIKNDEFKLVRNYFGSEAENDENLVFVCNDMCNTDHWTDTVDVIPSVNELAFLLQNHGLGLQALIDETLSI